MLFQLKVPSGTFNGKKHVFVNAFKLFKKKFYQKHAFLENVFANAFSVKSTICAFNGKKHVFANAFSVKTP